MNQTVLIRCPCCAHIITIELSSEQPCQDRAKDPPTSKPLTEEEKKEFDKQLEEWKGKELEAMMNKRLERVTPTQQSTQQVDSNYVIGKEITEQLNHPVTSGNIGTLTACPMCHGKRELLDFEILGKKKQCPLCKGWGVTDSNAPSRLSPEDEKVIDATIAELRNGIRGCPAKCCSKCDSLRERVSELEKLKKGEVK